MAPVLPTVIVVVDDDPALCELLQALLQAPGRVVDTVVGVAGLTAELLALSQPRLVLLNPRLGSLSLPELGQVVTEARALTQARFVLMVTDEDLPRGLPAALGADRQVAIQALLQAPLEELALEAGALAWAPGPAAAPAVSALSPEQILAIDFDQAPAPPPRPAPPPARAMVRQSAVFARLSALIDEELEEAERPSQVVPRFEVALDSLSDHNLVVRADRALDGVFVSTLFPPRSGARVLLKLTFPWGQVLEAEGTASWQRPEAVRRAKAGVGVTLRLTDELQAAADRFLALRQPLQRP